MKKGVLGLILIYFCLPIDLVQAQVVITPKSIPQVNDTLEIRTDKLPDKVNFEIEGSGAFWDFKSFSAPYIYQFEIKPGHLGAASLQFPMADGVIESQEGYEIYTRNTKNTFSILGYSNYDFMNLGLNKPSYFDKPLPIKSTSLKLNNSNEDTYLLYMPIENKDIPNEVIKKLPYTPDSARYVLEIIRESEVKSSGTLDLHIDNYNVLRESILQTENRKLEIKNESIPWQDVSELFEGSNLFGSRITRKEMFWSDKAKVPVAELFIDPVTEEVEQVNFTSHPFLINETRLKSLQQDIFAYPNPTLGKIRFNLINMPSGVYKIQIINLLSVEVWSEDHYINQNKTIKLDLSHLRKGTYFYRLKNEQGKTIGTKRLIIIKP